MDSAQDRGMPVVTQGAAASLAGAQIALKPDEVWLELRPLGEDPLFSRLSGTWHDASAADGSTLAFVSESDEVQTFRLRVSGDEQGWSESWPEWIIPVRNAPELLGGSALDAQDGESDNGSVTMVLLPRENRTVYLRFTVPLDRHVRPGRYNFTVTVTEIDGGESVNLYGQLVLVHPLSRLVEMLPALYRSPGNGFAEHGGAVDDTPFLSRFLLGFQDFLDALNRALGELHTLYGAYSTPSDFIRWLGTWVALVLDENWPEVKRRRLIAEAVQLYRWRGTRRGLCRYLEIYTGHSPEVNDRPFRGMRLGAAKLGEPGAKLGDVPDHTFVITIAVPEPGSVNIQAVRDIIDAEKPAHTAYRLRIVSRS